MWFLPTRGRPDQCRELIAAMRATGDVPEVAVMIDDDPAVYAGVPWPNHWHVHVAPEHLEMTRAVNTLLALHPGHRCYGLFGDHFRPMTPMFDALREAAGDWFMAWPNDNGDRSHVQPAGAPTFGTKLIEALGGWICLPTTVHVSTDRLWWLLWKELGIAKHLTDCKFTRTYPLGRSRVPRNYKGVDFNDADGAAWQEWEATKAPLVVSFLRMMMMQADGYRFDRRGRIASEYGCTEFNPGF